MTHNARRSPSPSPADRPPTKRSSNRSRHERRRVAPPPVPYRQETPFACLHWREDHWDTAYYETEASAVMWGAIQAGTAANRGEKVETRVFALASKGRHTLLYRFPRNRRMRGRRGARV